MLGELEVRLLEGEVNFEQQQGAYRWFWRWGKDGRESSYVRPVYKPEKFISSGESSVNFCFERSK